MNYECMQHGNDRYQEYIKVILKYIDMARNLLIESYWGSEIYLIFLIRDTCHDTIGGEHLCKFQKFIAPL